MIMIFIAIDTDQTMQEMIVQRKCSVLLSSAQDTISAPIEQIAAYDHWKESNEATKCYMMGSILKVLQKRHEVYENARQIMDNLQDMFGGLAVWVKQAAIKSLMSCKKKWDTPIEALDCKEASNRGFSMYFIRVRASGCSLTSDMEMLVPRKIKILTYAVVREMRKPQEGDSTVSDAVRDCDNVDRGNDLMWDLVSSWEKSQELFQTKHGIVIPIGHSAKVIKSFVLARLSMVFLGLSEYSLYNVPPDALLEWRDVCRDAEALGFKVSSLSSHLSRVSLVTYGRCYYKEGWGTLAVRIEELRRQLACAEAHLLLVNSQH
ncbi:hypothetical protein TIFTF001_013952 [Ficus carica]|uniref:Uncharacterized protein n=1 Tax=Ficus carica TaxID=3494 RepID=A0AA87ZVX4_FICCA|nr:hypothetical protein TIFTF001_013952 [Ficus carica]